MAAYERQGAELERRWAGLVEPAAVHRAGRAGQATMGRTWASAKQLGEVMSRTADALERSAELAEDHALRRERAGRMEDAAVERRAAERTREAAARARSEAKEWLNVGENHIG